MLLQALGFSVLIARSRLATPATASVRAGRLYELQLHCLHHIVSTALWASHHLLHMMILLQAFGLAVLMARAGLAVPAEAPVQLPAYTAVLADIGDEQSLSANLSTFSGHLKRIQVASCSICISILSPLLHEVCHKVSGVNLSTVRAKDSLQMGKKHFHSEGVIATRFPQMPHCVELPAKTLGIAMHLMQTIPKWQAVRVLAQVT